MRRVGHAQLHVQLVYHDCSTVDKRKVCFSLHAVRRRAPLSTSRNVNVLSESSQRDADLIVQSVLKSTEEIIN